MLRSRLWPPASPYLLHPCSRRLSQMLIQRLVATDFLSSRDISTSLYKTPLLERLGPRLSEKFLILRKVLIFIAAACSITDYYSNRHRNFHTPITITCLFIFTSGTVISRTSKLMLCSLSSASSRSGLLPFMATSLPLFCSNPAARS